VHDDDPRAVIARMGAALNAHDVDALEECFADDYVLEAPAHPARSFSGASQVRKNQQAALAAVPDLRAIVVRTAVDGETAWAEWEWCGTRRDGSSHLMRGVTINGIREGRVAWARFFMEPVEIHGPDVETAIRRQSTEGHRR
jgi:ketosteroid isomerase-like protein